MRPPPPTLNRTGSPTPSFWKVFLIYSGFLSVGISHSAQPQGNPPAQNAPQDKAAPVEVTAIRQTMVQRKQLANNLKQSLEAAKTPEEKKKVMEAFRTQNQALMEAQQKALPASERHPKSSTQVVAEMKAKAQGNPQMLQRVNELETKLQQAEKLKAKVKKIQEAPADQKPQLIEEFNQEREKDAKERLQKAQARQAATPKVNRTEAIKKMPPEMQAMVAKQEQRRQEVEALKESLKTAGVEERKKLVQAWQQKQQAEMAQRQQAAQQQQQQKTP